MSETYHRFVLVSEEDDLETEVCIQCGAQRDKNGLVEERAFITGGWPSPVDCDLKWWVTHIDEAFKNLSQEEREKYEECQQSVVDARLDDPRSHR